MKIIHQNGYSDQELALYRLTIYKNTIDCAKALTGALRQFDITPELESNLEGIMCIESFESELDPERPLDAAFGSAVKSLWKDPCIDRLMEHSSEFYLMDSAP